MALVLQNQASFGDMRTRDVFHRNSYAVTAAATAATPVSVQSNFYGITGADSTNSIGASTQFELVKMVAVEPTADSTMGRLDISINGSANSATAGVKVAELSAANAKFVASTLSADFGSSYTTAFTKGLAQDGTTDAVKQTFTNTGTSVELTASSNRLYVKAANADLSGEVTVQGDRLNWYQKDSANTKKSAANQEYIYTHNAGTVNTSTGVANFNLDPQNVLGNQMLSGAFNFNSFNAAGTSENVLHIGAGKATGTQEVLFSNASVGVGIAPSNGFKLDVVGNSRVDGNITVTGDLLVSGNTTTIDVATVQVEDKNIAVAYNVSDPALFDGAGITAGTGASSVFLDYSNNLGAWNANIGFNVPQAKGYTIDGGYNTTLDTGVTLNKDGLYFGSDNAVVKLGTAATITKDGFNAASNDFAVTFGAPAKWRVTMIGVSGTFYLAMQYTTDQVNWVTKFSVSP
jgi:hypothetical protein